MKTITTLAYTALVACTLFALAACDDNDPAPEIKGETFDIGDGSKENFEITTNTTLAYPNTYNLRGFVYVPSGVTLTIEPGVIIKGEKATQGTLIVERGGKLVARGTRERPVVFTSAQAPGSRRPGDWGGIILLGKAPNNMGEQTIEGGVRSNHGGSDPTDNSGVLSYVRCEFAGIEYSTDNEINGITFGSVGSGTTIDHLQVSYSGDDAFEWFGGTVNARYLVALASWDDDFDTDNGFSGKIQFAVCARDPRIGDKSASNAFESDNNATASATPGNFTRPVFANVTLVGPVTDPAAYTDQAGVNGSSTGARFQAAFHLRRNTQLGVFNSLAAGFPIGLIIENDKGSSTRQWATDGLLNVTNCVLAGMVKNFQDAQAWANNSQFNAEDPGTFADGYFHRANGGNRAFGTLAGLKLSGAPFAGLTATLFPAADSPLVTANAAAWTHPLVSSWFQQVNYVGAFGPSETLSSNWMSGWCNFDPQNTVY
ncbi:MAG: hypothetical protein LBP56_10965 [Odoribacteraceae bacterium]|jgi:hypothetical protein|nr:hypothetical protein [Odoribacteraceae bacterium]